MARLTESTPGPNLCVRCGLEKPLTFEHIPPRGSGENRPGRLYDMLEALTSDTVPWDFRGRRYKNAQRGTGGYYLCADCNSMSGRETVPAYLEMIRQTKEQNVFPIELEWAGRTNWHVRFQDIEPHAIVQQVVLMLACMNSHHFVKVNDLYAILNDNGYQPELFKHGLYVFINAGAMSTSYPVTAVGGTKRGVMAVTGVFTGTYSFQLEVGRRTNPYGYADISNWITDYKYGEKATFDLIAPVLQTNVGLPGVHSTRTEVIRNREEAKKRPTT